MAVWNYVAFASLLAVLAAIPGGSYTHEEWDATLKKILDHDPRLPPGHEVEEPTTITVQLYIASFDSIREASMDFSISTFLRQFWRDPRLKYKPIKGIEKMEIDPVAMGSIWVPDLFFNNEKTAVIHEVTVPNKLMQVYPDGRVVYSLRVTVNLRCDMNLKTFPFDTQLCQISMESFGYSVKNLLFEWHDKPLELRRHLKLPQFEFVHSQFLNCTNVYSATGTFACLKAQFHMKRKYGYFIAQVYVPSVLIVILSWVSFWLDIDAVPARITLGLLTVLTMTTQSADARSHLPRVSYIKAIDVWMAMCLVFVFAALIEFAYVNVNARLVLPQMQRRHRANVHWRGSAGAAGYSDNEDNKREKPKRSQFRSKEMINRAKAHQLDVISRYAFPIVFTAFNIFYWVFYLQWSPAEDGH